MDTFAPFAPTVVTDHRPITDSPSPIGLRALLGSAVRGHSAQRPLGDAANVRSIEALVAFDFGAGTAGAPSPVNQALAAAAARLDLEVPVLAQHETATLLAREGRVVIDLEAMVRERSGNRTRHVDTATIVQMLAMTADRAGWTTIGVIAHPAHLARCVAICQRHGLHVAAVPVDLPEDWDRSSAQWWTRRPAAWASREVAVIAHHLVTGHVLLRL